MIIIDEIFNDMSKKPYIGVDGSSSSLKCDSLHNILIYVGDGKSTFVINFFYWKYLPFTINYAGI